MLTLKRLSEPVYSAMRAAAGFLFVCHGLQKLFGMLGGHRVPLASQYGVAGAIETAAGTLILIGLFTSMAALISSAEMAAAYFIAHAPRGGAPIQNGGEAAVFFCFVFLYLSTQGDGRWSVRALLGRRSPSVRARAGSRSRL